MANIEELAKKIRDLHKENKKDFSDKVEACFELMTLFCRIKEKFRTKKDIKNCCYAALILSGIVDKKVEARTRKFMEDFRLPEQAERTLFGNRMRMAGF